MVRRLIDQALLGASDDLTDDLAAIDASFAVSVVTNAEIISGVRAPARSEVTRLLNSLRPLPVTDMIAHRAGELRRRYRRSHAAIGRSVGKMGCASITPKPNHSIPP